MAYLGDDRALEKAIERLPPFSAQTRTAYLDLASSVAKKWEAIKATKNEQPEESMKGSGGHSKKREKKRKDARHLVVAVVALPPTFRCHESRSTP